MLDGKTGDTLRSPTVTPKLQRIAAQAARDADRVFTTLAYLIDEDFLREAYRQTSKSSAPGIDGVTAQQYAEHLDENLRELHERVRSGCYQATPGPVVARSPQSGNVARRQVVLPSSHVTPMSACPARRVEIRRAQP